MPKSFTKDREPVSCDVYLNENGIQVPECVAQRAGEFYLPAKGARYEKASFAYQASRYNHDVHIEYTSADVERVASLYPAADIPDLFKDPTRSAFDKALEQTLYDVPNHSTPGWPYNSRFKTMGELFESPTGLAELYDHAWEFFKILASDNITTLSAEEVFLKLGVVSHLFIKDELHTKEKVDKSRYRLIFSVPILVNLMERLCCAAQNKLEIANWERIPSKPGLGFTDEMSRSLIDYASRHGLCNSTDMSGWDWTVNGAHIDFDRDVRLKLVSGQEGYSVFATFLNNVNHLLTNKVVALSNGELYAQSFSGVIASGSYRTSPTNSRIRIGARYKAIGDTEAMSMGDDCVEGDYGGVDPVEAYAKLGFILKDSVSSQSSFEFCSKKFESGLAVPMDPVKMLLRFFVKRGYLDAEITYAIKQELRHCPESLALIESYLTFQRI